MNKKKLILSGFLQFILFATILLSSTQFPLNGISITSVPSADLSSKGILWTPNGTAVCTADNDQSQYQLCSDGAGGAIITWFDNRGGADGIYAQRINSSGSIEWTGNGTAICTEAYSQWYPQLCSDGAGGAIITWDDHREVTNWDIYAQRINSSGDIEWTGNGTAICTEGTDQISPQICSDGAGGAIITWHDQRSGWYNIYAQRINSSGDIKWTPNGTPISTGANQKYDPELCSDGVGGAVITWRDHRGSDYDIYAQRINSSGDIKWTIDGTPISTAANNQWYTQICSDGAGGAIITWLDERDVPNQIYAQRINSSGGIEWTGNGTAICTEGCSSPQLCSDGAGGAIITWHDYRDMQGHIYAQHINSGGIIKWTGNGTAICTEVTDQQNPQLCSDGAGGAIITWMENRSGLSYDIYAQQINSAGALTWTGSGTAICTEISNEWSPQICSDGAGGAVITWAENRSSPSTDIYAQRVGATKTEFPWYLLLMQGDGGIIEFMLSPLGLLMIVSIVLVVIVVVVVVKKRK